MGPGAGPLVVALAVVGALLVTLVAGVGLGTVESGRPDTLAVILSRAFGLDIGVAYADATETIVWELRLPRVLTAMVVGAGLAVAGATFQGLLRNPLADPYVLGTASGAALGRGRRGPPARPVAVLSRSACCTGSPSPARCSPRGWSSGWVVPAARAASPACC